MFFRTLVYWFWLAIILLPTLSYGQTGISVTPPRVYYEIDPGHTGSQIITVTNVSKNNTLDLSVSLGDWEYDLKGENIIQDAGTLPTSCASWISIAQGDYFSLKPGESKQLDVSLNVPSNLDSDIPAHTALLYVTQMNPVDDVSSEGANIKVSVRSGIKIYHRTKTPRKRKIDIQNLVFNPDDRRIELNFENQSNVWTDGVVYIYLLNMSNGTKRELPEIIFYTMPGNKRLLYIPLPEDLKKGRYTATILIDHGDDDAIEAAELRLNYE